MFKVINSPEKISDCSISPTNFRRYISLKRTMHKLLESSLHLLLPSIFNKPILSPHNNDVAHPKVPTQQPRELKVEHHPRGFPPYLPTLPSSQQSAEISRLRSHILTLEGDLAESQATYIPPPGFVLVTQGEVEKMKRRSSQVSVRSPNPSSDC